MKRRNAALYLATALCFLLAIPALAQDARPGQPGFSAPEAPQLQTRAHFGSSPFDPPEETDSTFVVDRAGGLDTGCTFRSGGPLTFNIPVKRVVGDQANLDKLKASGLISQEAYLRMPAFDVDFDAVVPPYNPERDRVTFNGNVVPGTFLTGSNGVWKFNSFRVPIDWVEFASSGSNPAMNEVKIFIDVANGDEVWCTAIDWASLEIQMVRPVVMAHGILSNGGVWNDVWVPQLESLGIPAINDLNMGNLDSIGNNAGKIGAKVEEVMEDWGVDKVNLVSHSKGGLDSRHYVENQDTVEKVIQLGTPNAGSPLADTIQSGALRLLGPIPTIIINVLAGPAGVQLTTPYMSVYNAFHGSNPEVEYTALAGDYDPDCFFCVDRLLTFIVGRGDTIVPVTSVHALGYTRNLTFATTGADRDATHTSLEKSLRVYNITSPRVRMFGRAAAAPTASPTFARTATVGGGLAQGDVATHTVPVDQAGPVLFSLFYQGGELAFSLVSPSGQVIDPTVAALDPDIDFDDQEILGGRIAAYGFATGEVGLWTVKVEAISVSDPTTPQGYTVNAWFEAPQVTLAGGCDDESVTAGSPLDLLATVREGGSPLLGATVEARVALPDGSFVDLAFADDGIGADATAGDGVYSARLTTSQVGFYKVAFTASGTTSAGDAFSREAFGLATASASSSHFLGFRDFGVDSDGDGFYNQLQIEADLDVDAAADYRVFGVLTDSAGNVHQSNVTATLAPGTPTVTLSFDGEAIFNNRVDGPYTLSVVRLSEEGDLEILPVDEALDAHVTSAYAYTQFEHSLIRLSGNGTATGIDFDGNGLYDQLRVDVEVEVDRSGFYQWSAQLTDRNGTELGFNSRSAFFSVGSNTMSFFFDGGAIGENGVDGPYFVSDLLLFGANANLVATNAFATQAFLASEFEGFVFDDEPPVIELALDPTVLWPPNHRMVTVEAALTVTDNVDANPVVTLVSIVSDEPDDGIGDGNTSDDIQGADYGTDDRSFELRAERSGTGEARTYTVTYEARDSAGNVATATATVTVPHDLKATGASNVVGLR